MEKQLSLLNEEEERRNDQIEVECVVYNVSTRKACR